MKSWLRDKWFDLIVVGTCLAAIGAVLKYGAPL